MPKLPHRHILALTAIKSIARWRSMTLQEWLSSAGKSREWLADELDVDLSSVCRYLSGARTPRWDTIVKIRDLTDGRVTADSFMPPRKRERRTDLVRAAG